MNYALRMTKLSAFIVVMMLSAGTFAQTPTKITQKSTCMSIGVAPPEPVGDREGHTYSVIQYICQNQGGPFDGSVSTGTNIWEADKGSSVMLTGGGVIRKPGMSAVYVLTEAKSSLTMADGKVTGFSGTAKGVYKVAAGTASSLAGKSFTSTYRSIGAGQFVIEMTVD
ncbi:MULTISPECIES: hypothetical protein [unclassified Variovorax]|uniref:hypothetical protein n=1 Tax=unclassified Variovorax TaxID=663243 RepID=UPI003ED0634F